MSSDCFNLFAVFDRQPRETLKKFLVRDHIILDFLLANIIFLFTGSFCIVTVRACSNGGVCKIALGAYIRISFFIIVVLGCRFQAMDVSKTGVVFSNCVVYLSSLTVCLVRSSDLNLRMLHA